jgi:hypothetical protein
MVTMRAIQPLLVWGPWGPIPPRANLVSRAKKIPVPSVQPPHFRSWLVPSSGTDIVDCAVEGLGRASPGLRADCEIAAFGSSAGLFVGAGWVTGVNSYLVYFAATSMARTITPVMETYSHSGKVIFARRRWAGIRPLSER